MKYNKVLWNQSQCFTSSWACPCATNRLILPKHRCYLPREKVMFPEDVFLTAVQGRSVYCTPISMMLRIQAYRPQWGWKHTYSYWLFLWAHPGTPQNCHICTNDQEHPIHLLQASVSSNKAQWSLLSGTVISFGWEQSPDGCPRIWKS